MAITVADDLPATIRRRQLYADGFTCLHDPRRGRIRSLTEKTYFARPHVIVSHNADLRGIVEDQLGRARLVRCSVASFAHLGAILEGTALLATIPNRVADQIRSVRPHLAKTKLPFTLQTSPMELLWPAATDDDDACRFVREKIVKLADASPRPPAR
jgi:LysR family transcriptional activator of mexEF-oprN operon